MHITVISHSFAVAEYNLSFPNAYCKYNCSLTTLYIAVISHSGGGSFDSQLLRGVPAQSRLGVGAILQIQTERARKASAASAGPTLGPTLAPTLAPVVQDNKHQVGFSGFARIQSPFIYTHTRYSITLGRKMLECKPS